MGGSTGFRPIRLTRQCRQGARGRNVRARLKLEGLRRAVEARTARTLLTLMVKGLRNPTLQFPIPVMCSCVEGAGVSGRRRCLKGPIVRHSTITTWLPCTEAVACAQSNPNSDD